MYLAWTLHDVFILSLNSYMKLMNSLLIELNSLLVRRLSEVKYGAFGEKRKRSEHKSHTNRFRHDVKVVVGSFCEL